MRSTLAWLTLAACLPFAGPPPAGAAVWHLSPAGDDTLGLGTPEAPFRSLARGVVAAAGGDSLLLGPGVYSGEGQHGVSVEGLALSFIGSAGAEETLVELDSLGRCLRFAGAPADTSRIEGLSFRRGAADRGGALQLAEGRLELVDCRFEANSAQGGGALELGAAAAAQLRRCDFTGNSAQGQGGAIRVGAGASLHLDRCTLHANRAGDEGGALYWAEGAQGSLRNCLLVANEAEVRLFEARVNGLAGDQQGYAWVVFPAPPQPWDHVLAAELHLTGAYVERPGLPEAQLSLWVEGFGCLALPDAQAEPICHPDFSDPGCANHFASWSGDSLLALAEPWLWPPDYLLRVDADLYQCDYPWNCFCWLAGRPAERGWAVPVATFSMDLLQRWHSSGRPQAGGGALLLESQAAVELLHCTLAGNASGHSGGALLLATGSAVTLTSCVLSGNTSPAPSQLALGVDAEAFLAYCTVEGEDWGPGNLSASPAFIDPEDFPAGYALADSSPCIAAGDPYAECGEDLAGWPRPDPPATAPDQGCYESPRGSASAVEAAGAAGLRPRLALHPNPARGQCSLRLALPAAAAVDLGVYDLAGRRLRRLWSGALTAGSHAFAWDGRRDDGRPAASGVYFLRMETAGARRAEKLVWLR